MPDAFERLRTLPMAAYHDGRYVTASFVDAWRRDGGSWAMAERRRRRPVETRAAILIGVVVHCLAQRGVPWTHSGGNIVTCKHGRGSKAWDALVAQGEAAVMTGEPLEGIMTEREAKAARHAFSSLIGPDETPAKRQALSLLTARKTVAEGVYPWDPVEGLTCAVRPDVVVRRNGKVIAVPIKTTAHALTFKKWWKMWEGGRERQGWITSACLHHYGLMDANGGEPVPQVWITVRTCRGFPWSTTQVSAPNAGRGWLWGGQSALEMMAEHWYGEIIPALEEIREWRDVGYGPEEEGV